MKKKKKREKITKKGGEIRRGTWELLGLARVQTHTSK